jgi:hypothetical protein
MEMFWLVASFGRVLTPPPPTLPPALTTYPGGGGRWSVHALSRQDMKHLLFHWKGCGLQRSVPCHFENMLRVSEWHPSHFNVGLREQKTNEFAAMIRVRVEGTTPYIISVATNLGRDDHMECGKRILDMFLAQEVAVSFPDLRAQPCWYLDAILALE